MQFLLKLNRDWHEKNVMPRNASLEQRIDWHLEHSKNCGCRPIPKTVQIELKKRDLGTRKKS